MNPTSARRPTCDFHPRILRPLQQQPARRWLARVGVESLNTAGDERSPFSAPFLDRAVRRTGSLLASPDWDTLVIISEEGELTPVIDVKTSLRTLLLSYKSFLPVLLFSLHMFLLKTFKALNGLLCADVPLRNYSLTHSRFIIKNAFLTFFLSFPTLLFTKTLTKDCSYNYEAKRNRFLPCLI